MPMPPHELPIGAPARRAMSRTVSFLFATALFPNGEKLTRIATFGAPRRLLDQTVREEP
jgi:hypothetical protein